MRITVGADSAAGPPPQMLENLPVLHRILAEIVGDWHRAVEPFERRIAEGRESPDYVALQAMTELQAPLLKALFSYVLFFVAADHAYAALYAHLNRVNRIAKVKHDKPPTSSPTVEKARAIRNSSIAHFPSDEGPPIDAEAAMSWTPMTLGKATDAPWNLRELTFGGFTLSYTDSNGQVVKSRDLEVQGMDTLHRECIAYLESFDRLCADYLHDLHKFAGTRATAIP